MPESASSADWVRALIHEVQLAGQATPTIMRVLEHFRSADIDVAEAGDTLAAALSLSLIHISEPTRRS